MSKPRGSMHTNPLLGASGSFTLDSPALLVPAASPPTVTANSGNSTLGTDNANSTPTTTRPNYPPTGNIANFFQSPVSDVSDPFANVGLSSTASIEAFQTSFDNASTFGISGSQKVSLFIKIMQL